MSRLAPGAIPSPNIWQHPEVYELENRAVDPDRRIEAAMRAIHDWSGQHLLDLGCGTGFHLPRWAADAARVTGVEPHPDLLAVARRRTARLGHVEVLRGTAQRVPLPDASVDVVQARWAYFFGPGCEPGLAELERVVRRGGTAFVIDNDATRSTFGRWFLRGYGDKVDPAKVEAFWAIRGWTRTPVDICWRFETLEELESVVRIEFTPEVADAILAEHRESSGGPEIDYAVNLWSKRF